MPKNTQKSTTTASYGQIQPQSNQYTDAFANWRPQMDPTIAYRAAGSKRSLENSLDNPAGGYRTPQMRDALLRSGQRQIDEQAAMASRAGQYDVNSQRLGQLGSVAAMMQPRIVQTGGTSNTEAGQNLFGNLLNLGMGAANMAMY